MSWRKGRCRHHWHGASDDDDGGGGRGASQTTGSGRWRPGLRRRRHRRASEPKAPLLLKQGGDGVAKARQERGVRHVVAGRWDEAAGLNSGVPERHTVCGDAWLKQQRGL